MISLSNRYLTTSVFARTAVPRMHEVIRGFSTTASADNADEKDAQIVVHTIAKAISKKNDITILKCQKLIDDVFSTIAASVADGKTVRVKDFGTFKPVMRSGKTINSFGKGKMTYAPKTVVKFSPFTALKESTAKSNAMGN